MARELRRLMEVENVTPWRLINMKFAHDAVARIDAEARRLGLTRTTYMLLSSDPSRRKELRQLVAQVDAAETRAT